MAKDLTVFLKKNVRFTMIGVVTEEQEDLDLFERSTYRDIVDASVLGRPVEVGNVFTPGEPGDHKEDYYSDLWDHEPPRQEMKTRSRFVWKDATPEILGWAWADEIVSIATGVPTRI